MLAVVTTLSAACSSSEAPESPYAPDPDRAYEYAGEKCEESGIHEIVQLGDGLDLEFEVRDEKRDSLGSTSFDCIFNDSRFDLEMSGDDADSSNFIIQVTIVNKLENIDVFTDLNPSYIKNNEPIFFQNDEYSDGNWDNVILQSFSSMDGDIRFVDLQVRHQHLIITSNLQVSPDAPDFFGGADYMSESNFDQESWEDIQEFDDAFQQELVDFNFEVADNLKQALLKDNGQSS